MVAERPKIRYSLRSATEAMRVALKDANALCDYVEYGLKTSVENRMSKVAEKIGFDDWGIYQYWTVIENETEFKKHIDSCLNGQNYGQVITPELLYVIVRKLCPTIFVETGVAAGVSSAYILKAMQDNNYGHLYSIDYPNFGLIEAQTVPLVGFVVPDNLKDRWTLLQGKSSDLLPQLLDSLGVIDIFMHDSEHSHNNMLFEYETSWMKLREGGLLLSHDINDNSAFKVFAQQVKHKYHEIFFTGMGVIRK